MKILLCSVLLLIATVSLPLSAATEPAEAPVFEMRIYYPAAGKTDAMLARFRDHTCAIFARLGAENVGYWMESSPAEGQEPRLYYVLRFPSREAATRMWTTFRTDPQWIAARDASEVNGRLVAKVDSIFMTATDFSAIK